MIDKIIGKRVISFEEIGSTNDEAKRLALDGEEAGVIITAESQSSGRGRLGRNWDSEKGSGLFMSVILRPQIKPADAQQITLIAAIAVARVIRSKAGLNLNARIKWPNDILISGKKVCGILTESNVGKDLNFIIVGIGINVNNKCFSGELKDSATSLYLEKSHSGLDIEISKNEIFEALIMELNEVYYNYCNCGGFEFYEEEYNSMLIHNNPIRLNLG